MLVMKIDKELSTKECIEYGEQLSKHLGEKVVILDKKVISFERLEERYFIPLEPFKEISIPVTPYEPYWYYTTCCDGIENSCNSILGCGTTTAK